MSELDGRSRLIQATDAGQDFQTDRQAAQDGCAGQGKPKRPELDFPAIYITYLYTRNVDGLIRRNKLYSMAYLCSFQVLTGGR